MLNPTHSPFTPTSPTASQTPSWFRVPISPMEPLHQLHQCLQLSIIHRDHVIPDSEPFRSPRANWKSGLLSLASKALWDPASTCSCSLIP